MVYSLDQIDNTKVSIFMHVIDDYGVGRVLTNLVHGFVALGKNVDILVNKTLGLEALSQTKNVNIIQINEPRSPVKVSLKDIFGLAAYLRKAKPELLLSALHYNNEISILAKSISGVRTRVIVTEHSHMSENTKNAARRMKRIVPLVARFIYPFADEVVSVSEGVADDLSRMIGLPRTAIKCIYNPVITSDLWQKSHVPVSHPWFNSNDLEIIIGLGRLETQKDFSALIRSFQRVHQARPNCRLVIIGQGSKYGELKDLIDDLKLGDYVDLMGYSNNPYAYLARAKALVLTSRWEGLPTVLIEAMALGIPVISTDCPSGPREILNKGQYGRLVPMGDIYEISKAVVNILEEPPVRVDPNWLYQFTQESAVQKYLNLATPELTQTVQSQQKAIWSSSKKRQIIK